MKISLIYAALLVMLLSAFAAVPAEKQDDCIEVNYSYAFRYYPADPDKPNPTEIPLSPKWQPQLSPEQTKEVGGSIILELSMRPDDTLWFSTMYNVIEYKTKSRELVIHKDGPLPYNLFVDRHGNLWGNGFIRDSGEKSPDGKPYFLARFDDTRRQFESVENDKLTGELVTHTEDANGALYFYTKDDRLLKYTPDTGKVEKLTFNHLDYEVTDILIDRHNTVWFKSFIVLYGKRFEQVQRYRLTDDSFDNFGTVPGFQIYGNSGIFIDSSDKLWLNDFGYLDNVLAEEPVWYQVMKSPVFIHDRGPVENENQWDDAYPIFESKDHRLWFFSGAGLAYLDQQAQKWCLLTSRITGVAEDSSSNIWIAYGGQIYKRENR